MDKHQLQQEKRINERKAQILAAAAKIFAQQGFQRATTKEIAEMAGVSEGTIYNYFENKADLLVRLMDSLESADTRETDLQAGLGMNLRDFFVNFTVERLNNAGESTEVLLALLPEALIDPEVRERIYSKHMQPEMAAMEAHAQKLLQSGQIKAVDIPLAVRIIESTLLGIFLLQVFGDEVVAESFANPQKLAEGLAQVLLDGLASKT